MNLMTSIPAAPAPEPAPATPPTLLRIQDLAKTYRTKQGEAVRAIDNATLTLGDGEFVSVVGPSGCGKSTLLKILAGIHPASGGSIEYRGARVARIPGSMGVVFQGPVLLPWLSVLDNVLLPARVLRLPLETARTRARDLLDLVGLGDFSAKYPNELSGGMQQRASIARGLLHDPPILLMDEPFGALDALTRERMSLELQRIWMSQRKTVFFITHSILESIFLSDRVLVMSARPGRIVREFIIPFRRPRDFDLTTTAEFGDFVREVRHMLGASAHE